MNTIVDTQFLQCKTIWSSGGTEGLLVNEKDDEEESDEIDDFKTQKEHRIVKVSGRSQQKRSRPTIFLPLEEPIIIPVVHEFYLDLKEREAKRPFYEMRSSVKVRGVNILVTERSISKFYDAPYYYRDYFYKIDLKEFK
ncbi:hypothetical protein Goarm_022828, partial [Gossypium armourianum]|nr:hypothetical protein [Gossypium armourianum]